MIDERKTAKIKREQKKRLLSWRVEDEEYRHLDREVKKNCRTDKRRWLEEKEILAQKGVKNNNIKALYRIVRKLSSSRGSSGVPTRSKNGRALLSDGEQEARWVECFREVQNQPTPSMLFNSDQETPAPTLNVAIKSLKNIKAPGLDEVAAELLNHGQEAVMESLTNW